MHCGLYVVWLNRQSVRASVAGSINGYENIILQADAAEVVIFFKLVEIEEVLAGAFALPFLYQRRNEIKIRSYGDQQGVPAQAGTPI